MIWDQFIRETAGEFSLILFHIPHSVFYSTVFSFLRKKTPEGAKIKDTLERREAASPHSMLLIALF